MGKHIGTGGLARGKILGRLAFYTWVDWGAARCGSKVARKLSGNSMMLYQNYRKTVGKLRSLCRFLLFFLLSHSKNWSSIQTRHLRPKSCFYLKSKSASSGLIKDLICLLLIRLAPTPTNHTVQSVLHLQFIDKIQQNKLGWAGPHSNSKFFWSSKWTQMFWNT